ncbi:MAG: hypothetical protein GY696_15655 [Gammaproteobacteria bacterium]|nr:hypothetical protein [Gammaproteobacteria bacterium]
MSYLSPKGVQKELSHSPQSCIHFDLSSIQFDAHVLLILQDVLQLVSFCLHPFGPTTFFLFQLQED